MTRPAPPGALGAPGERSGRSTVLARSQPKVYNQVAGSDSSRPTYAEAVAVHNP